MTSLFSSFDLKFHFFPLFSFFFFILMTFFNLYKINYFKFLSMKLNSLNSFFLSLKHKMFTKFSLAMIISFMLFILILNFVSIFPFNFPHTSNFGVILIFGLGVWASFIIFSTLKNIFGTLSHFIPEESPLGLSILLFAVELVSNFIRPITLSVRLVANILAGHLLMILLSKLVFLSGLIFPLYILLNLVELFVALIQSYIFCTMICLYFSEVH